MDPVRVSYRWTAEELLEAQKTHQATIMGPGIVLLLIGFYLLMTGLGLSIIVLEIQRGHKITGFPIGFTAFWLLPLLAMQFSHGPVHRFLVRKKFSGWKDADAQVSFELSSSGLKLSTLGGIEASFPWSHFSKLLESKNNYLLYFGKKFYWLPNSAFSKLEDREILKSWVLDANIPVIVKGKRVRQ